MAQGPTSERAERLLAITKLVQHMAGSRLSSWRPHPKQADFHKLGATHRERALLAGNQLGKTQCAGMEVAMHLTGLYPDWWEGLRFSGPIRSWVGGPTAEHCRDNPQRILLGTDLDQPGVGGCVPASRIRKLARNTRPSGSVDHFYVQHVSGGQSYCGFKSYDIENPKAARKRWQGDTLDLIWLDEEPPQLIYGEALARISSADGNILLTMTPLLGMTEVVRFFYPHPSTPDRGLVMMTIEDALHYSEDQRRRVIAGYSAHERDARTKGIPLLGSGRIFPLADEVILIPAMPVPDHWSLSIGIDFGWGDHPTAAVLLAEDRAADTLYVTREYRNDEASIVMHARALRAWGKGLPVSWPHDGEHPDRKGGDTTATNYRKEGLMMAKEFATFPPSHGKSGGYHVQPGVDEMLDRMRTGRWKVFDTCALWMEEFRLYHREQGKIVKKRDDLLSASRYAMMMRRIGRARSVLMGNTRHKSYVGSWDPLGGVPGGYNAT